MRRLFHISACAIRACPASHPWPHSTFEPGERLNVGQIVEVATLSRSAVSHHLKILREAGVLESVKEGKEVYFWIAKAFLVEAMEIVLKHIREKRLSFFDK